MNEGRTGGRSRPVKESGNAVVDLDAEAGDLQVRKSDEALELSVSAGDYGADQLSVQNARLNPTPKRSSS
jgi:RNase P/RNase MRP subunit p29